MGYSGKTVMLHCRNILSLARRGRTYSEHTPHPVIDLDSHRTNTPLPQSGPVTVNYIYDSLYRLEEANYSTGEFYHYTYDTVGNRLTETTHLETNTYTYDNANRLASVNSVSYTFDNNGNLLNDGVNSYTYDTANRLISDGTITYTYNGMGDRYQQTVSGNTTTYVLDLNTGLTQVLEDNDNAYFYGLGRIAQVNTSTEYFMGDALGSVRQLVVGSGNIALAKSYEPYGETLASAGNGASAFAFTGEQTDPNGLTYLRARYYAPKDGRFLSRDTWGGNANLPTSMNRWAYAEGNPVNFIDPSGHDPCETMGYCFEKELDDSTYIIIFYQEMDITEQGDGCELLSQLLPILRGLGASSLPIAVSFYSPRNLSTGAHLLYEFRSFNALNHTQYLISDPRMAGSSASNIYKADIADIAIKYDHISTRGPILGNNPHIPSNLIKVGRVLKVTGNVLMVVAIAHDAYYLEQAFAEGYSTGDYTNAGYQATSTAASWAGAWVGTELGTKIGLTVGTMIAPGPGTVIGGVVGGVVGGILGAMAASKMNDVIWSSSGYEVEAFQ